MNELFELWCAAVLLVSALVLWKVDKERRRLARESDERWRAARQESERNLSDARERLVCGTRIATGKAPMPTSSASAKLRPCSTSADPAPPAWSPSFDYAPAPTTILLDDETYRRFSGGGGSFDGAGASGDWTPSSSACDTSSSSDSNSGSCSSD